MRLINTSSLKLDEFWGSALDNIDYAILSHTWSDQEVTFQELTSSTPPVHKSGYAKILRSCDIAKKEGFLYIWIDTCCIDKTSSAELSESINSMFTWYWKSKICYAHLTDVSAGSLDLSYDEELRNSRWFTRGWTLQELIAPEKVVFYNRQWQNVGTRKELAQKIASITSIDAELLQDSFYDLRQKLSSFSVSRRMSWAKERETTREEDIAYCLMGIFDVNMPLLYGEGKRAFMRLQEEIIKINDDQSILAWTLDDKWSHKWSDSVFAPSPKCFGEIMDISFRSPLIPMSLSPAGLSIYVYLCPYLAEETPIRYYDYRKCKFAILEGHLRDDFLCRPAILLEPIPGLEGYFRRIDIHKLYNFQTHYASTGQPTLEPIDSVYGKIANINKFQDEMNPKYSSSKRVKIVIKAQSRMLSQRKPKHTPPLMCQMCPSPDIETQYMITACEPPISSETSVIQPYSIYTRPIGFHRTGDLSDPLGTDLCGFLYLENCRGHGFFVFWGAQGKSLRSLSQGPWLNSASPFVCLMSSESVITGDYCSILKPISKSATYQQEFSRIVNNLLENGSLGLIYNNLSDTSSLAIKHTEKPPTTLYAHAKIGKAKFLDRMAWTLDISVDTSSDTEMIPDMAGLRINVA